MVNWNTIKSIASIKRTRMVDKKLIPAYDPYMDELIIITKNLEAFLDSPSQKTLAIEKNELNGLEGNFRLCLSALERIRR